MRLPKLEFSWAGALLLVVVSAAAGLLYNAFGGIPLIAVNNPALLATGGGLIDEDGIHLVGLDAARKFYLEQRGPIIDARTPELYAKGHIPGALSCYVYELKTYLPPVLEKVSPDQPLLIYCTGADCEDSRFLAQTMQELGFKRMYVYEGGFSGWQDAGMAVQTGSVDGGSGGAELTLKYAVDFGRYVPGWLWIAGELLLVCFGVWVFVLLLTEKYYAGAHGLAARLVGFVFVLASLHKIATPEQFAAVVNNYRILPLWLDNVVAIIMPWVELLCGILLMAGRLRAQSALVLACLLLVFIAAISFNIARGVEFDCGCFGSGHTPPWRVLLRDVGLLMCTLPALAVFGKPVAQKEP